MNANHAAFAARNEMLMFESTKGRRWVPLFTPSEEAKMWDGATEANAAFGMPSILRDAGPGELIYAYIKLEVVGRKERLIPGTGGYQGARGVLVNVTFNVGTEDESTSKGWLVQQETN